MIQTLEELKDYVRQNNLPLDRMRFCLDEDKREPRWFGIYYNQLMEEWIVYKNKDDGTRFTRYRGKSEKEAVTILFEKMTEEACKRGLNMPGESVRTYEDFTSDYERYENNRKYWGYHTEDNLYDAQDSAYDEGYHSERFYQGSHNGSRGRSSGIGGIIGVIIGIVFGLIVAASDHSSDHSSRYHSSSYYDNDYNSSYHSDYNSYDSGYSSGFDSWDAGDTNWSSDW